MQDCTYVFHIPNDSSNALPKDGMQPMEITKLVLNSCSTSKNIRRLVITSSDQAVVGNLLFQYSRCYNDIDTLHLK